VNQPLSTAAKALMPLLLVAVAVVISAWCAYVKLKYGGWMTIVPGFVLYPAACIGHVVSHIPAARAAVERPRLLGMIVVSHLCLVAAFLVQYDMGDGPRWLTITELLGMDHPLWLPHEGFGIPFNILVFAPVVWTWIKLRKTIVRGPVPEA
jgi:hypothetical protein